MHHPLNSSFERPASIPMMSSGEQKLLLSIVDSEGVRCRIDRRPQKNSNDFCHKCVDPNIELLNGNRSCFSEVSD